MRTRIGRAAAGVIALAGLAFTQVASAALVQGDYLGTFDGNASEASMMADLGLNVSQLAKVDWPDTADDGLSVSDLVFNDDNEAVSGGWSYSGPGVVDYIVVKAGNMFAVYHYTDANTGGMPNMGIWDTGDLDNKGVSHISAYMVVPIPAAGWLLVSALAGFGLLGRRRKH